MEPTKLVKEILDWLTSGTSLSFSVIVAIVVLVATWRIFTKAGEHGWAVLIPFYDMYVAFRVAGLNPWLFLLMFIPVVNFVMLIVWGLQLGATFGKGALWSLFLLVLLPPIGLMILGFGSATHRPTF